MQTLSSNAKELIQRSWNIVELKHVYREQNEEADGLAKCSLTLQSKEVLLWHSLPGKLISILS